MTNLRKYLELWPIPVWLILSLFTLIFHLDAILVPTLKGMGFRMLPVLAIAYTIGTIQVTYLYWFWGWVRRKVIDVPVVQEEIEFVKEVGQELQKEGFIDKVKNHLRKKFHWLQNGDHRVLRWIKGAGFFTIILVTAIPFLPGSRSVVASFCGATGWKAGFYILCLGNFIKMSIVVGLWTIIWRLVS